MRQAITGALVALLLFPVMGCAAIQNQAFEDKYIELLGEHTDLIGKHAALQSDLSSAQRQATTLSEQLQQCEEARDVLSSTMREVRFFENMRELDTWIDSQAVPSRISSDAIQWFDRARRLQERALEDGYIINVELDPEDDETFTVLCTATLQDGSYCWWDPDVLEVYYWLDYNHF